MIKTARQLKDLIRNLSRKNSADAQILMRNYMMERFLERISLSEYRDKFILKGGMLVAAMVGLDARSTMDLDATVKGANVNVEDVENLISAIVTVPIDDGVKFQLKSMLLKRQAEQNELKELFGDEYTDYGLVFCSPMGTPIEGQVINRALNKLIEDNGLPKVVFHSLRHSSITYKLKLNGGDMKSVQGDSGHAQLKMVADVYSHIIDEDRRLNAKRFEDAFYSGHKTEDELDGLHARSIEQAAAPQPAEPETDQQLLLKLLNNPEMAALLKTLAKSL